MSHAVAAPAVAHPRARGARLGPGTLLWNAATDWRSGLSGLSAGLMQLMWPHLGQGVEEHSAFFTEPWDRINRSLPQIWGTILAPEADERGRAIRDLHRDISGTDRHGNRYHALDPATFWWAHATFTWEMFETHDRWSHGNLRRAERERLYAETVTWYRRYGVSDRVVPVDLRAFRVRFDEICRDELELTPTAERAIDMALHDRTSMPGVSGPAARVAGDVLSTMAIGCLPPVVRERFGIPWSVVDEARLRALTLTVRNLGAVVPRALTRGPYLRAIMSMGELAAPRPVD